MIIIEQQETSIFINAYLVKSSMTNFHLEKPIYRFYKVHSTLSVICVIYLRNIKYNIEICRYNSILILARS